METEQPRQLADDDADGDAGKVADAHRFGDEIGEEAEARNTAGNARHSDENGEETGQGHALAGVAPGDGDDRSGNDRRNSGIRPQHQDARGAKDRVGEQGHHRRVETVDGREAGELRVGHTLGNQESREHEPGHEVAAQP